jgi:hypothetical protein
MSLGDAWKPPADGSHPKRTGKIKWAESAQCALEDEEFEHMTKIYAAAVSTNDHHHNDGSNNPKA